MNQKHVNWVEFLQGFIFVLKNISGKWSRVVDTISRRNLIMHESQVEVLGFDFLKDLYGVDSYFHDAFEACRNTVRRDWGPWSEYMLQDGMLLKNNNYVFLVAPWGKIWYKRSIMVEWESIISLIKHWNSWFIFIFVQSLVSKNPKQ